MSDMKRWLVESGSMKRTVRAIDEAAAVRTALRAERCSKDPGSLGQLTSVIEITGNAETTYLLTERHLKEIGAMRPTIPTPTQRPRREER